jgi:NitT/TauT family transport system ATP-binding protein
VSKVYESSNTLVHALDDISLDLIEGEFVVIVGASGCGKTTLLNIVADLIRPSIGMVQRAPSIERPGGMGMVFQAPTLLPWRSVLNNVLLPAEILGTRDADAEAEARALLRFVGLAGFENSLPHELSGGMQQRVSLCRAMLSDPPLLLMDEPFGALDAITREQMTIELQRVWMENRKTVLYVTHSITEAILLSDRIVAMTPRPGAIAGVIDNEIPRPRTIHTFETPEFSDYSVRIRELISFGDDIS